MADQNKIMGGDGSRELTEFQEKVKWYIARDTLFADNGHKQNIFKGIRLARQCDGNPDAKTFLTLYDKIGGAGVGIGVWGDAGFHCDLSSRFLAVPENDPNFCAALYFGGRFLLPYSSRSITHIIQSAQLNYGPALGWCSWSYTEPFLRTVFTEDAISSDRELMAKIGYIRIVHDNRKEEGLCLLKKAAELGHTRSQFEYGMHKFEEYDIERYKWLEMAALRGSYDATRQIIYFVHAIDNLYLKHRNDLSLQVVEKRRIFFELGRIIKCYFKPEENCQFFGFTTVLDARQIVAAKRLGWFYDEWCKNAKKSIFCWILVSKHIGIVRDVEAMITDMLLDVQFEWADNKTETPRFWKSQIFKVT